LLQAHVPFPAAVSYRRERSFSNAFITILSSSPRTSRDNWAGSVWRVAARLGRLALDDSRVLGRGMRGLRLRYTVRQMIVAVAVIGLCCSFIERFLHGFEDTVYAIRYSERRFSSLRIGMTKRQVEAVMGIPIRKNSWIDGGDVELWRYSESPSDGNYWRRWVFCRDGKVYWIDCRFYWD
jgi:hypothetical protein